MTLPMSSVHVRTAFIFANPDKQRARQEVPRLRRWLASRGVQTMATGDVRKAQVVLTLGGDGTILAVASRAAQAGIPILGINTGRMGFMTAVGIQSMYTGLQSWLKGNWNVSERQMLEVTIPRMPTSVLALNEAVVRLGSTTRVTTISISINEKELGAVHGDGVIVATTTGSTAYSLAAQGPVVHPQVEALILTPVCPHSLTQRPLVFPSHQTVELRVDDHRKGNEVQLCVDGHRLFILKPGDRVRIKASEHKLKLLQDPKTSYYGVLKNKLSWGGS